MSGRSWSREAIAAMSNADYAEHRDEIHTALEQGLIQDHEPPPPRRLLIAGERPDGTLIWEEAT